MVLPETYTATCSHLVTPGRRFLSAYFSKCTEGHDLDGREFCTQVHV